MFNAWWDVHTKLLISFRDN